MVNRKPIRTRGKLQLSKYFQELKKGDRVAVDKNPSFKVNFPRRIQGRTGEVEGKRGGIYIVKLKDQDKKKVFLINPIHLKKIKSE